jgi:hypothetical protein
LRSRALTVAVSVPLIGLAAGCGLKETGDGPPAHPGDLASPRSLLITQSDVKGVGAGSPYGVVLRWWRALQRGSVAEVRRSYGGAVGVREAKREIREFAPRFSQPVEPDTQRHRDHATVDVVVRSAVRLGDIPGVVNVQDLPASFALDRRGAGWRLRPGAFARYRNARFDAIAHID